MNYNTSEIDHLIRNRRSIKPEKYTGERVQDEIIKKMLENASWAPNHGKTEPWKFVVFTNNGLQEFAEFQATTYKNITPPDQFIEAKYQKFLSVPLLCSHIIMIVITRQESGKIPLNEEICAVACAVQNMLLTATANNIGAYWSTGGMTYKDAMRSFLQLGDNDLCLGMVYVGNFTEEVMPATRIPFENKTVWVG